MANPHVSYQEALSSPADNGVAITPADGADLATSTRGVYVGGGGDLKIDLVGSGTVTLAALVPGIVHPIRCKRVYATGTTATSIIGVW